MAVQYFPSTILTSISKYESAVGDLDVHDRPVGIIISCVAKHSNLVHFCRLFLSQSALDNFLTPLSVG